MNPIDNDYWVLNSTRDEKVDKNRIEEVLLSSSSLVSGPYEASGVKFSWGEGFQESPKNWGNRGKSAY